MPKTVKANSMIINASTKSNYDPLPYPMKYEYNRIP